ncbi:sulfite exporter TauE/SafE family protein [Bacillus sp. V33-4]|uniref:sulfite exporter TauE/SafE family protein n=1 Tax=Bacillus sp. V33-4 TaxID=2054169 RepID=UPI000C762D80|nr:sulfite exporter TauE/SafE family protein [Bacillus sp. V33-4]PLR87238.1 sulfite exporter TauE/SafE family protein [Bacillus sp. V33-4]
MEHIALIGIGLIAAFIGTLAGSGGLIGMPSMLLLGIPVHTAIASAKFSNIFSSFSSFFVLLKRKHISFKSAIKTAPFALGGGVCGGLLANSISDKTMTIAAIILLSIAFILTFVKKPQQQEITSAETGTDIYPYLFGISVYDGMFGPGQATLLMYTYLHKGLSYIKAMAYTRFQTFISCFGALFSYIAGGAFDLSIALYLSTGSIIGAQLAVRMADRVSVRYLKRLLHLITILLIIQLIFRALT